MPDAEKTRLFLEGAQCAADFLRTFDGPNYKALREIMAEQARADQEGTRRHALQAGA
ncbi:hypothetical protein [Pseudomonas ovata]|uniref:hypothetical protein n=1 Tax=Pseudomonas ovata TaxID=1839709 RepID=UPI00129ABED2|nr:hypothetical protein [Pseudomonas ovata]